MATFDIMINSEAESHISSASQYRNVQFLLKLLALGIFIPLEGLLLGEVG